MSNSHKLPKHYVALSFPTLFNLCLEYSLSLRVANTPLTLAVHCLLMGHKRLGLMDDDSGRLSLLWDVTTECTWDVRRKTRREWEMSSMSWRWHRGPKHALWSPWRTAKQTQIKDSSVTVSREKVEPFFFFFLFLSIFQEVSSSLVKSF